MVCVETRHMKALLKAQQINKSDPNDARGIAQMMRVGLFKPVHVKTLAAQQHRMLLTSRKLVQRKLLDIECDLRGTLRNFGLKVGPVSPTAYDARIRDLVQNVPALAAIVEPLLSVRRVMREQLAVLHKMVLDAVRHDPVCRRFMTVPGVGPLVAHLSGIGRSAAPVRSFARRWRACRADTTTASIGRDRLQRRRIEMRRYHAARGALRSGAVDALPQPEMVMVKGMGCAGRSTQGHAPRHRRARQKDCRHPPSHVD